MAADNNQYYDENGVVAEPDWGVLMFWEDLSYIFTLIADFFKKLFNLE